MVKLNSVLMKKLNEIGIKSLAENISLKTQKVTITGISQFRSIQKRCLPTLFFAAPIIRFGQSSLSINMIALGFQ